MICELAWNFWNGCRSAPSLRRNVHNVESERKRAAAKLRAFQLVLLMPPAAAGSSSSSSLAAHAVHHVAKHVPSRHFLFDSSDISRLGLHPNSTWAQQQAEFEALSAAHPSARRVMFLRHGEGIHNAAERDLGKTVWESTECLKETYFDPPLNEVGVQQGKEVGSAFERAFAHGLKVDAIVVSPLTRAIETAMQATGPLWTAPDVPRLAVELARERFGKNICDKRKTRAELAQLFPNVDFASGLVDDADVWHSVERETPEHVRERVNELLKWILASPYKTVLVVGHSDYMSHAVEVVGLPSHWPSNCELVPMHIVPV